MNTLAASSAGVFAAEKIKIETTLYTVAPTFLLNLNTTFNPILDNWCAYNTIDFNILS